MPSVPIAVSIADVLEVRGGPLKEGEVWALLCQSAAAIQDFFIKGASGKKDDTIFAISPTTLTVCRDGQVTLTPGDGAWHGTDFSAPEVSDMTSHALSDTAIEKMFLYTLGKTLQVATEFGLLRHEYVSISDHLDSLLEAMCEQNPAVRIGLRPILEACDLHIRQHPDKPPYSHTISRLYISVLGSIDEAGHISSGDNSRQSTLTLRSRRRPRHPHFHRHDNSPPSARSRSRSRSPNRGDPRPVTHSSENQAADGIITHSDNTASTHIPQSSPSPPPPPTNAAPRNTHFPNIGGAGASGPASSVDLNASFASSDQGSLYRSVPAYRSATPLLSLRMGSPAYEKYLQLKDRQRRVKAAKTGEKVGVSQGDRASAPLLMALPSSTWRGDLMDYMTDARSMASLMSYTLGNYLPELHNLEGPGPAPPSAVGLDDDLDLDAGSLLSSDLSYLVHEGHQPQQHPHNNQLPTIYTSPEEHKPSLSNTPASRLKRQREEEPQDHQPDHHQQQQHEPVNPHHHHHQQQQDYHHHQDHHQYHQDHHHQQQLLLQQQEERQQQLQQFGSRDLTPTPDPMPVREFYGPEFVYRASRPMIRISLPLQGESVKNPALVRRVIIVHLTGQKFEAIVDPSMTGRQLFDAVVTHTGLDDFFFFGLTYVCEGEHFFLDADTKLHKMAPEGWREGAKGHMPPVTFTLYLRIKFYPDSLADFRHGSSQHLLYLQLRRDVLEERCMATDSQLLSLAGLALHAEFGDYRSDSHRTMGQNYFVPEQYLPARVARRLGMGYVHDRALEAHRDALGLAPSMCEIQFIKTVQGLPEYGIHFYKLMRAKNDTNSLVWVGLTQTCLLIADQNGPNRTITRSMSWPSILKISFNKRRFSLQPKVDPGVHIKGKPPKLNFFTSSYRKGRYLLQLSTAQHRFHIRMRTRAAALETMGVPGESLYGDSEDQQSATFMPVNHELYDYHATIPEHPAEEEEEEEKEEQVQGQMVEHGRAQLETSPIHTTSKSVTSVETTSDELEDRPEVPPLKYRNPPPYRPNLDFFMQEFANAAFPNDSADWLNGSRDSGLHALNGSDLNRAKHGTEHVANGVNRQETEHAPSQQHSSPHHHYAASHTSPHHPHPPPQYNRYLSHLPSGHNSLGRHVFEVTLTKDGDKGIGLTIVGGETTGSLDLGIFVKTVMKDGPAAKAGGKIQPGDRLIAINGISLEGVQHHEAVQLIKDSGPNVALLISQMRPPATIRRKSSSVTGEATPGTGGATSGFDIDDEDNVCHSDEEVAEGEYLVSLAHTTDIPKHLDSVHAATSAPLSHSHRQSSSSDHHHPSSSSHHQASSAHNRRSSDDSSYQYSNGEETVSQLSPSAFEHQPPLTDSAHATSSDHHHHHHRHHHPFFSDADMGSHKTYAGNWRESLNTESQIASPTEQLSVNDLNSGDLDPEVSEVRDEVLLSEELLASADMDTVSYGSSDIRRALARMEHEAEADQEAQEMQILGDIADMTVDTSDTDSDFEEAVQATVEGRVTRSSSNISSSGRTSVRRVVSASPDAVIYEVVLEKERGALGIVIVEGEEDDGDRRIYIKELTTGGPAERGGILHPGDRLLEVNSFPLRGATAVEAENVIQSSPDLCLLKVARTRSLDELSMDDPVEQAVRRQESARERSQLRQDTTTPDSISAELVIPLAPLSPPSEFASPVSPVKQLPPPSIPPVVSPPPPLSFDLDNASTPQDDDLHNSRSELDKLYLEAGKYLHDDDDDFDLDTSLAAAGSDLHDDLQGGNVTQFTKAAVGAASPVGASSRKMKSPSLKQAQRKSLVRQERVAGSPQRMMEKQVHQSQLAIATPLSHGSQYGDFTVDLEKPTGGGLGFTVVGGVSTTGGCYVKAVVQDPALSDGRLRPGDRLIQVNGRDMTGLSHFEAVTFLRQTPAWVSIKVRRYVDLDLKLLTPTQDKNRREDRQKKNSFQDKGADDDKHPERGIQTSASHTGPPGEKSSESAAGSQQQRSQRQVEEGLGFEPRQSVKDLVQMLDTPKAIIRPYAYGRQNSQTGEREKNNMEEEESERAAKSNSESETGVMRVTLHKRELSDSLGFSLVQHRSGQQSAVYINTLTPGSAAHRQGQLRVGDRLLQVNGTSLIGCSHTKAVRILRDISGNVVLTISRATGDHTQAGDEIEADANATSPAVSDLDPDPSNSTNSSDMADDDDINDILDEAINYLEKDEEITSGREHEPATASQQSSVPSRNSETTGSSNYREQQPESSKPVPKPRARRGNSDSSRSSEPSASEDGNSETATVKRKHSAAKDKDVNSQTNTNKAAFTGYVRKFGDEKVLTADQKLTEEWLLSLLLMGMEPSMRARSTQLLQLLAEAVEEEEPLLEFQRLRHLKATDNSSVAKLPQNKTRNRYRNVLPYDFNRVRLQKLDDSNENNDYINASDIHLAVSAGLHLHYLTCQGPLSMTLTHFWQMVWENEVSVVAMATQEVESEKVKCHQYWPASAKEPLELCEGRYIVRLEQEQDCEDFVVRHLSLSCGDGVREVVQLHYLTWPDHGVPDSALPLLRFVRLMHLYHRSGPFVVHCSAGIGRSGVLMAVDTALARMENGQQIDLFDIVSELRRQRYGMIQTQDQYLFCYTACMEALLSMER